jgi:hypothetical protein
VYDDLHYSGGGAIKAQAGRPGMPADKEAGYQQRIQDLENQVHNKSQATPSVCAWVTEVHLNGANHNVAEQVPVYVPHGSGCLHKVGL